MMRPSGPLIDGNLLQSTVNRRYDLLTLIPSVESTVMQRKTLAMVFTLSSLRLLTGLVNPN
ncbi:hypothetical protein DEO72_LG3g1488 [Vigna unguiculata]|uniref:Uncharacterized protein n=1 Tax=Vigna unguiculata TaxID=3917 RepID=A0A4D6LEF8_VIGUN|nr:hypothetical protein DEO72_LG3g1488 [Vigna unguiculata]